VGTHTIYFKVKDSHNTWSTETTDILTINLNQTNHAPTLSGGIVTPESGYITTDFTYFVNYTDLDNDPPAWIKVSIDASSHNMTLKPGGDGNYTNGEIFEYSFMGLAKDVAHTFQFTATDGMLNAIGDIDSHSGPVVQNSLPSVVSVTISPEPAYTNTNLTASPSGWYDADGDSEGYQWQWQKNVTGSWQNISDATSGTLDHSNFVRGDQIKIICVPYDGTDSGNPVNATIAISNSPPIADAGPDKMGLTNTPVILDGSGSWDADSDPLGYNWTQILGTPVTLLPSSTVVNPSFNTSVNGTYAFSLTVSDAELDSLPDTVNITVKQSNEAPTLSNGTVSPVSGYTATNFTYSVNYTDADNDPPASITVSIDGGMPQGMTVKAGEDGNYVNGETYQYTINGSGLGLGSHNFTFAASDGIANATGDIDSHSGPQVEEEITPRVSGGGGGGGGGAYYLSVNMFGSILKWEVSRNGNLKEAEEASSEDGRITISLGKDTACLGKNGARLENILVSERTDLLPLPDSYYIISKAYKLEPEGATFDPYLNLTLGYEDNIPQYVSEEDIYIACYSATSESWVPLTSQVDIQNNTVTAQVRHFTDFAVMGIATPPPAEFTVTSLDLSSEQVKPGEPVTISAEVTNTGGSEGSYILNLTVNGEVEQTRTVTLAPEATRAVTFTITKEEPGSYSVSLDGETAEFVVLAPSWLSLYWWTIVAGIVIAGLLVYFLVFRKRRARPTTAE